MTVLRRSILLNGPWDGNFSRVVCSQTASRRTREDLESGPILVADGGLRWLSTAKTGNDDVAWFGDGDSTDPLQLERHAPQHIMRFSSDKPFSDFGGILDTLGHELARGPDDACLFADVVGGLGGRRDHEYVNLLEAARFVAGASRHALVLFHDGALTTAAPFELELPSGTPFTLLSPFVRRAAVEIHGARFSGYFEFTRPSHGLSNESADRTIRITPKDSVIIALWQPASTP